MIETRLFPSFKEELPKVEGKVFAITGTTSGTGFVAARTAAELGGEVILLNRKSSRAEGSLAALKEAVPDGNFVPIECDLQDFASVRRAIVDIKSKYSKIYCLANNAGVASLPDKATVDGYDVQMQTNHLAHFLLTAELFPLLQAEADEKGDARIVIHSSNGRLYTPNKRLEEKYLGKNGGNLGGDSDKKLLSGPNWCRYFQSKLANSVFAYALHEKFHAKQSKIRVICCHPGRAETSAGSHMEFEWFVTIIMSAVAPFIRQSSEDGAMGLVLGMMHPKAESGVMYGPANGCKGEAVPNVPPEPYETDPATMEMLWQKSEDATGVKFKI
jgi:NAD(P)-dependent dehydrogenase (short-subunit alcohol dehydrogenase family)